MFYQNKQIPTNKSGPEEQHWRCQSCSAVWCSLQESRAPSLLLFAFMFSDWRLLKFILKILVASQRWMQMSETLGFLTVIRNNSLDFYLSNIYSNWETPDNPGGVGQKSGLYEFFTSDTDTGLFFYYYSVTKHRTCIKNSLSRWTRIKFYFSLTWIENCRETVFSTRMIFCRSWPHALNVIDMSLNSKCHLLSSGSAVYLSMCKKWIASKWFIASKIECENNNRSSIVKVSYI